jgi:hypothetical protein
MLLCDITPAPLNFEKHAFKYVDCNHVEIAMVEDRNSTSIAA